MPKLLTSNKAWQKFVTNNYYTSKFNLPFEFTLYCIQPYALKKKQYTFNKKISITKEICGTCQNILPQLFNLKY